MNTRSKRLNSIYGMQEWARSYGTPFGHVHISMETPFERVFVEHTAEQNRGVLLDTYTLERFGPHDETELLRYVLDRAEETYDSLQGST